jgi:hypothetical protein
VAGALGLDLEDAIDELFLAVGCAGIDLELTSDLTELGDTHLTEIADVEVVALARGLELLLLLVLGDGGSHGRLGSPSRTAVA